MTVITDGIVSISNLPILCWRNLVNAENVYAESDPDFPVTNVGNPSTALKWRQDITDSPISALEYLTIDVSAETINYVAVVGHNFATAEIAVGVEVDFYSSPPGEGTEAIPAQIPADDGPLIFLFSTLTEVEGLRLKFVTTSTPAEIAVLFAGQYTEIPEGIQGDHTPLPLAVTQDVTNGRSENGAFLGRIVTGEQLGSVAVIANLELDWVRDELIPFLEFAGENPFFWAWSPDTYPDETAFAWLDSVALPTFDIDGYAAISLSMRGIGS